MPVREWDENDVEIVSNNSTKREKNNFCQVINCNFHCTTIHQQKWRNKHLKCGQYHNGDTSFN